MDAWRQQLIDEVGEDAIEVLLRADKVAAVLHDPVRALADLQRLLACDGSEATNLRQLRADPLAIDLFLRLGAISRFAIDLIVFQPGLFWTVVQERQFRQLWGRVAMDRHLRSTLEIYKDEEHRVNCLHRFKQHHYLRLMLSDLTGALTLEAIVCELSDMTDVLCQAAMDFAQTRLSARFGTPNVAFSVIGMGKLGGRELNYSSDIDLIFVYEDDASPKPEEWDCHQYCQRMGSEIIRLLDESGPVGRLYRVDMRLRPEGDKGELALSLRETIDYYYTVGRPWERQALIKARRVAGNVDLAQRFFAELRPWIYPQERAWEGLDSTRAMRRRIEDHADDDNVKTGPGGIRDIEFLVQFFQLSHGGRIPELRSPSTLPTMRALADRGIIPYDHAFELERHYLWLRLVEHRLQIWDDRQVHEVPRAEGERASLAFRCGMHGNSALRDFDTALMRVRTRVRTLAERHYLGAGRQEDAFLALLTEPEVNDALAKNVLASGGFKDCRRAAVTMRNLANEPFFVLHRSRTERSLVAIMPQLLALIGASPDPDATLENFQRIASAVGGRATFFELLAGSPRILRLFVDLAGWSTYLVEMLQEFPGLPDDLVDSLNQTPRRPDVLLREARSLVHGLNEPGETLRYFQAREMASTAVRDLEGADQRQVNRQLSHVADAILGVVAERCTAARGHEWGFPVESGRPTRFAVLGLGKLGSKELSYASDMDVIFVSDPGGVCHRSQRSGEEFWTKVAQELMRVLGEGRLYSIDPRLRPWGDQSELVPNTTAIESYWRQPRDLWERMAMLRISHIAGNPMLGAECIARIRDTALSAPLPPNAAAEVRDMRRRLEESVSGRDHVKRGWGGYVDHEFIAHYLSFGVKPELLPYGTAISDTLRILGSVGRIPSAAVEELVSGLNLLRFVEARMRLTAGKAISSIPQKAEQRSELARRCKFDSLAEFDLALHLARENARKWFDRLIV